MPGFCDKEGLLPMGTEINTASFRDANRFRRIVRYLIALSTGLVGIADMLSAIVPRLNWSILLGAWPILNYRVPAQSFTVVIGFFLIMLSYGLARGKKHAWRITLVLLVLSALLHVRRSGSVLATIVALLLALLLYMLARFFQAKSDPPSVRRGYVAICLGLGIVSFYAIGGFLALYDDFAPWIDRLGFEGVLVHLLNNGPLHVTRETPAFFFQRAFPILCISAILYGMIYVFRPVAAVLIPETEERSKAATLARRYGTNSISYFALGEDKSYFFSDSGNVVISYVLRGSTAVVAGDPIGPEEEMFATIKEFVRFCSEQDWTIVFWQVRDVTAELYRNAGFRLFKIGEDAVVNTQTFTLKGGTMANVRSSAKRAEKDGVHVLFYQGKVTNVDYVSQMEQISRAWLAHKGGSEMGFSMGHFDAHGDTEQLYALAIDTANKVHAFVSFVPIYGRRGWGLDLMRRAECCAPGTMELLLARTIEEMKSTGIQMASLGLAPLSNANGEGETFLDNSIDFLTDRFGNPEKNQSLFNFKKKFQPTWESRYLVYSDALNLPKIGWALYNAHQEDVTLLKTVRDGFVDWVKSRQENRHQLSRKLKAAHA
jgi:phosphatidylglycerol lysyltransferase